MTTASGVTGGVFYPLPDVDSRHGTAGLASASVLVLLEFLAITFLLDLRPHKVRFLGQGHFGRLTTHRKRHRHSPKRDGPSVMPLPLNNILLGNHGLGKEPPCQITTTRRRSQTSDRNSISISSNEGPGDFSTQHRKYTCEFSKPGIESFTTTYQSNPDVHGQPTATDRVRRAGERRARGRWLTRRYLRRRTRFREAVRKPSAPTSPAIRPLTGSKTTCNL